MIVIDASLMVAWLLEESALTVAEQLNKIIESETLVVPAHWTAEVGNALLMNVRRGRLSPARMSILIEECSELDIVSEMPIPVSRITTLVDMARVQSLTFYDAIYVELAREREIPLGTLDNQMREAARRLAVPLFPETTR